MNRPRIMRVMKALAAGAILLQFGGCNLLVVNEFVQTILLGITAAGGIAIMKNI
ncbi:MAG: hypothetical protein V1790_02005 [Planctomycetota bacterium]